MRELPDWKDIPLWKRLGICPRCDTKLVRIFRSRTFFCPKCHPEAVELNERRKEKIRQKLRDRKAFTNEFKKIGREIASAPTTKDKECE